MSAVCCDVVLTLAEDVTWVTCETGGNDANVWVDSVVVEGRASSWSSSLSSLPTSDSTDEASDFSLGLVLAAVPDNS